MASTYLYRTLGTTTNANKGTVSHWIKRSGLGGDKGTFSAFENGGSSANRAFLNITSDTIYFYDQASSTEIQTNRLFRDTSAWYHIVIAWDTTQGTSSNRIKIYVNGVQETSFSTANYPAQNATLQFNISGRRFGVGCTVSGGNAASFWDGSISHFHFIDGTQYAASDFGSTDSTTGEWKINTSPSVTYGNNGFFWLKDNIATTDNSPNSNTFTVGGGTLTKTEDSPSNVFCTMNPLTSYYAGAWTFSNGNNTVNMSTNSERYVVGTLGFNSGKWYWENKYVSQSGDTYSRVGIESNINDAYTDYSTSGYGYRGQPAKKVNNGTFTDWGSSYTMGDIIGVAVDMDNNKIYFSKNGVWQESGDPTSGSTGTGAAFTIIDPPSGFYFPKVGKQDAATGVWSFNFGNGYFGTTAVASAGTNASGIGIFEYDVPTGYTALSTKGLNL